MSLCVCWSRPSSHPQAFIGSNTEYLRRVVDLLVYQDENVLRSAADAISLIALKYVVPSVFPTHPTPRPTRVCRTTIV